MDLAGNMHVGSTSGMWKQARRPWSPWRASSRQSSPYLATGASAPPAGAFGASVSRSPVRSTWPTGRSLAHPDFPSWEKVPIVSFLEAAVGFPVMVDNAATAAALGVEWQMPPAHGSFLYCYWGLGIGGGLVLGREAYRGSTGNAAEIGHIVVNDGGHACACGGAGASRRRHRQSALVRDARKYGDFATIEAVAAASDIPAIRRLLERGANRMAAALVSAINVTDVPEVIIGGAHFAAVEDVFLPVVREAVSKCVLRRHVAPVSCGRRAWARRPMPSVRAHWYCTSAYPDRPCPLFSRWPNGRVFRTLGGRGPCWANVAVNPLGNFDTSTA